MFSKSLDKSSQSLAGSLTLPAGCVAMLSFALSPNQWRSVLAVEHSQTIDISKPVSLARSLSALRNSELSIPCSSFFGDNV